MTICDGLPDRKRVGANCSTADTKTGRQHWPKRPSKPAKAKKSTKEEQQERLEKESEETYAANKAAIDTALRQCNAHLKKLTPEVARETIKRLKDYYLMHGI